MAIDQDGNPVEVCHCGYLNLFLLQHGLSMTTRCPVCVDQIIEGKNRVVVELQGHAKALDLMNRGMESQCELMDGLKQKLRAYEVAVKDHHAQKADDRCWMDDDRLYAVFGLEPPDRRVGDKEAMLKNCERYVSLRCEGGGPWRTYQELEELVKAQDEFIRLLQKQVEGHCERIAGQSELLSRRAEK